jgi:hypothetical protein
VFPISRGCVANVASGCVFAMANNVRHGEHSVKNFFRVAQKILSSPRSGLLRWAMVCDIF